MLAQMATAATAAASPSTCCCSAASSSGRGILSAACCNKNDNSPFFTRRRRCHRRGQSAATLALASSASASSPSAFRPCIDIHKGKVKQIVGSTLSDLDKASSSAPVTNFESALPPSHYSHLYRSKDLRGGHVIMLGADDDSRDAACEALSAWPGGLHVGGGVGASNARSWLEAGASHVIVTSAVFRDGTLDEGALKELVRLVGRERLVLDLSCRKKKKRSSESSSSPSPSASSSPEADEDPYFVVTDRWQKYSDLVVDARTLEALSRSCSEFLVHAVDVEGKSAGIDEELIEILGKHSPIPVTYAGGASTIADLEKVASAGAGRVDVTVGSALDIFGGKLPFGSVVEWSKKEDERRKRNSL